jgi:hypothetical protein
MTTVAECVGAGGWGSPRVGVLPGSDGPPAIAEGITTSGAGEVAVPVGEGGAIAEAIGRGEDSHALPGAVLGVAAASGNGDGVGRAAVLWQLAQALRMQVTKTKNSVRLIKYVLTVPRTKPGTAVLPTCSVRFRRAHK